VNVAEVMYTSPVVPRELLGLKTEMVHLLTKNHFDIFLNIYRHGAYFAVSLVEPRSRRFQLNQL